MQLVTRRLRESYLWQRFPKLSLGVVPSFISLELGVSLVFGYFVALFFAGSQTNTQGRLPSIKFRFKAYRIHVHHWLLFSHVLAAAFVLHFFVVTPFLFYGFLGGIVAQGVFHYEDWHSVIQKVS